jgi:hypothetical protein
MSANLEDLGYLTEDQTAKIYGVIPATLANWRCKRIGPPWYKRARDVVYRIEDIKAHLASRRVSPENESA